MFLTDYNQDYAFLLTVKTLRLAFYSLLSPLICIMPFENPTCGFSTLVPMLSSARYVVRGVTIRLGSISPFALAR